MIYATSTTSPCFHSSNYGPLFFLYSGLGSLAAACLGVGLGRALLYLFVWRDVISPYIPNQFEFCRDIDSSRYIFCLTLHQTARYIYAAGRGRDVRS